MEPGDHKKPDFQNTQPESEAIFAAGSVPVAGTGAGAGGLRTGPRQFDWRISLALLVVLFVALAAFQIYLDLDLAETKRQVAAKVIPAPVSEVSQSGSTGSIMNCSDIGALYAGIVKTNRAKLDEVGLSYERVMSAGCDRDAGTRGSQCVAVCEATFRLSMGM